MSRIGVSLEPVIVPKTRRFLLRNYAHRTTTTLYYEMPSPETPQ